MIQVGKLFAGRYRILKSIGRGGMAEIGRASCRERVSSPV